MENCAESLQVTMEHTAENGPSADFIYAISEFLDTDPSDLLVELGYYDVPAPASEPLAMPISQA